MRKSKNKKDLEFSINQSEIRDRNKETINNILSGTFKIIAKNESQKNLIRSIKKNEITICNGLAGAGKTFISLGIALELLKSRSNFFQKIYLIKSVTTLKGEELGYIKGDLQEKIEPFIWSFKLNLEKLLESNNINIKSLFESDIIRTFPLAYARGASLDNAIIIIDECFGGNTKIIIYDESFKKERFISFKMLPFYFKKYKDLKILSYNKEINKSEFKRINSITVSKNKKILNLKFNKKITKVTENHPYAILKNGEIKYKLVKDLKINDIVLKRKNSTKNHSILNEKNYDVLLGFLLGNGFLLKNKQSNNNIYRISKQHSLKEKEYNEFCSSLYNTKCNNNGKFGFTNDIMSKFQSKSFFIENTFYKTIYNEKHKKNINYDIINYISARSLAVWYMDDGNNNIYNEKGSSIVLHTEGFTKSENEILSKVLYDKFNIESKILISKKERNDRKGDYTYYYYLSLNNENSHKFQILIHKYIHPSMYYKLNEKYRYKFENDKYKKYDNYYNLTTEILLEKSNGINENVYNIEVDDNNNYYANNILVHNCQNLSIENARVILTRIGENSKMIILGDSNQIDLKNKNYSSLEPLMNMFDNINNFGCIKMNDEDSNIRNPIINIIEEKFNNYNDEKRTKRKIL